MSSSDKPPSRPAPPSPSHDAELEGAQPPNSPPGQRLPLARTEHDEVERIAGMSDDELASHLADGGVDVAALDAQVDSIREQIVASGIGAPSERSARARYREPDADLEVDVTRDRGHATALATARLGPVGKLLAICLVVVVAIAAGTALASLLR
jgi:hypothetical protein